MPKVELASGGASAQLASGTVVLGRFRCDGLLKSGHGVDTYVATDLESGSRVVVKRVAAADHRVG